MKILDIAFKDLVRSTRSLFLIGMAFAAPLLIVALIYFSFGSIAGEEVTTLDISMGVVNLDVLPEDALLEAPLGDNIRSMFFDESVESWITASDYPDEAAARAAVDAQEIGVAVIIPKTFTEDYLAGNKDTAITILQDPILTVAPTLVRDMVTSLLDGVAGGGIAFNVLNERLEANGQMLDPADIPTFFERYANWYADFQRAMFHSPEKAALVATSPVSKGEQTSSTQGIFAMVLSGQLIFFSFFTGSYSMMSILQESEEGTLARLFTTPTDRMTILAGKFLSVLFTVIIQGVVLMVASYYIFGVNWGKTGSFTLSLLGQMFASVGLAALLVSFIQTTKQAGLIFGGALTTLGMVSGLFTSNISIKAFDIIGNFTPQGWVLKAWRLTLAGNPVSELIVPFLVLVAMGSVMFVIGAMLFRRRFA
ncbi:MAG: ABC transporter permease [Anaerolineales bacterium]|nr:MAG: ABC transporter permease [Anaerolineales bacterium]